MSSTKTNTGFEVKAGKNHTMFIPAPPDDYGFNPEEFRVFARIMRRSLGSSEGCYESVANLVKTLFISARLIRRALKVLEACNAITRNVRPGKTDLYDFNLFEKWKPSGDLPAIRRKIDAEIKRKDLARKAVKKDLPLAETTGVAEVPTPCGNDRTPLAETHPLPLAETHYKGIPIEGTPIKVPQNTDAVASLASVSPPAGVVVAGDSASPAKQTSAPPLAIPGNPPDSADETFWDVWVRVQKKQGMTAPTARKQLGGLIKQFGTELVSSAVSDNLSTKADAFAYLKATLAALKTKNEAQKLDDALWLGEQRFVKDSETRQMIQNPFFGDPRFLPNFSVPNLIPEWYRATAAQLQARSKEVTNGI